MKYDFSGWATKNGLKCSDGRTIMKDAFIDNDGKTVPLVWNHQHNDPSNVLGHALLQNRDEGVYAYCNFNDTESGAIAKALVQHGDIVSLSIYANQLKQNGSNVMHGMIRQSSIQAKISSCLTQTRRKNRRKNLSQRRRKRTWQKRQKERQSVRLSIQ